VPELCPVLSSSVRILQKQMPAPLCLPYCVQTRQQGQDSTPSNDDIEEAVKLMEPYFQSGNYPEVTCSELALALKGVNTPCGRMLVALTSCCHGVSTKSKHTS
jgi:hypothetical protein